MATKRGLSEGTAAADNGIHSELSPNKRRKLNEETISEQIASFSNLPSDCKVHIFSNLTDDELNTVAELNKDCRDARNNESLNQERTGTIVLTERTTPISFKRKVREAVDVFTGNRTRLKIEGPARFRNDWWDEQDLGQDLRLPYVTSLDVSVPDTTTNVLDRILCDAMFEVFSLLLPNLQTVDLSNAKVLLGDEDCFLETELARNCPHVTKMTLNCSEIHLFFCGADLRSFTSLRELNLDNLMFVPYLYNEESGEMVDYTDLPNCHLLMKCRCLERLSLKDVGVERSESIETLSQDVLIKMVRNHSSLRWLRSDLSAENIAILKQERPEIEIVSE